MIITAGTEFAGTDIWMNIFSGGGFISAVSTFPASDQKGPATEADRKGHEARLMEGIWWRTNPDPRTGIWLPPHGTEKLAVRMSIRGLIRTEYAYLNRIVATVIDWRVYEGLAKPEILIPERKKKDGEVIPEKRLPMPTGFEWWLENYGLIREIATRRFGIHVQPLAGLLAAPETAIAKVFSWIGEGDAKQGFQAAESDLNAHAETRDDTLTSDFAEVFDEFYHRFLEGVALDEPFIEKLNGANGKITEQLREIAPEYLRLRERVEVFGPRMAPPGAKTEAPPAAVSSP